MDENSHDDPKDIKYSSEKMVESALGPDSSYDPSIAGVISNGFNIGGTNFLQILGISLLPLISALPLILSIFGTVLLGRDGNTPVLIAGAVISFALLIVTLYLSIWSQAALISGLVELIRSDQTKLNTKRALQLGKEKIWTYFLAALVLGLLTFVGFLFLIIPGLIVMVLFYFTPYAAIDGRSDVKTALSHARAIMEGNVGTFLLTLLVIIVLSSVVGWVPFLALVLVPFEAAILAYMYVAFSANTSKSKTTDQ